MFNETDFNKQQYEEFFETYLNSNKDGTVGGKTPDGRVGMIQPYLPSGRKLFKKVQALVVMQRLYDPLVMI